MTTSWVISLIILFTATAFAAKAPLTVDWTSTLKTGKTASKKHLNFATPTITNDRVYVGNSGGYFYSINFTTGKKMWQKKLEGPVLSKPLHLDGVLYLGDGKGVVYSVNAENGEINWHSYIGEEVMATPAADMDNIFVATQNNSVFALDKSAGTIKWVASRPMPFSALSLKGCSDPLIIDKKIFVGNTDGVLVVYDTADGKKLFTLPIAAGRGAFTDIDTSPLKLDNKLFFSTMEGALFAIDYKTGKDIWTQPIGTPNNIVYQNGLLYVTAANKVLCLRIENGETVWEKALPDVSALSEPAVSEGYVAVVSTDDKVYLLDIITGDVALERHLGRGTFGAPVIVDNRLIVLTNTGHVYAFNIN